jgi:acyl carrier protein
MKTASLIETTDVNSVLAFPSTLDLLRRFFTQNVQGIDASTLTTDTALLSSGILDSLAVIQLMSFIADELGIEIGDEDFTLENFETLGSLAAFIEARQGNVR